MTEPLCGEPGANDACTRATAEVPFSVCTEGISIGAEIIVTMEAHYPDGSVLDDHQAELVLTCPDDTCLDRCAEL